MYGGCFRPPVSNADSYAQVVRSRLSVFNKDIEITVLVEDTGVEQLILQGLTAALTVCLNEVRIWIGRLWVLIKVLHVGVCRRAVQIEVVFLNVFAVIAFAVCQTKEPLLKDRVLAVPERQRETENLVIVGNARQA